MFPVFFAFTFVAQFFTMEPIRQTDQKEQILGKATSLFIRYGIKSISMDDLARELGISKKTLYQYVENKADLIQQVFQRRINGETALMAQFQEDAEDAIDEMLRLARYVIGVLREISPTTVYDLQKYYRNIWVKTESLRQQFVFEIIRENLRRGMKQGLYRENMNPDIIAKLYVAKTSLVADNEFFPAAEYNMESLFREYFTYHIYGIASPKGLRLLETHLESAINSID